MDIWIVEYLTNLEFKWILDRTINIGSKFYQQIILLLMQLVTFENNAITASSTTKMGAVITYHNKSGTNALNTDIILQLISR